MHITMDTAEILVALNDPEKKDATVEELIKNARTIEDEQGEAHRMVSAGGLYMDVNYFRIPNKGLKNTRKVLLREDDIFLATCPKTGSHWLSNILTFLIAEDPIDDKPTVQLCNIDLASAEKIAGCRSPRVLHTHTKPELLPDETFKEGRKIVLLFRNPKDTAVSHYRFFQRNVTFSNGGLKTSWSRFLEHWTNESWLFFNFFEYYNAWQTFIQSNEDLPIHVVYFEDMVRDGLGELRKLQKYLGLNHNEDRLQKVLDKCSLSNLKAEVDEKKCVSPFFVPVVHAILYRNGEVGDWKNLFTVAQSEQMDAIIAERFKDSMFKVQESL